MKKQNSILALMGVTGMLLLSGCSTDNLFGVGEEHSACESAKGNGFCGAPSSIYKYKDKIKQIQRNYQYSGYPDKLFFSISREGVVGVKEDKDDNWQPYIGSKYEEEINKLLNLKTDTTLAVSSSSMDLPVGKGNDLSMTYKDQKQYIQTRTNVGRMIRDNGEYTRTWIAPYVDNKGDLISAHEVYSVIKNPQWIVGEKTPKRVVEAATPTPISERAYNKNVNYSENERDTLNDFLNGK